ncbi:hypothetical protein XO10_00450 [Marinitoga sp. 1135]|uniref:hypothetical protein n=1 Tax=Marinitoga sp. 1135 TaxID=1643333 RepID=UPI001586F44A|nr:hypothetical protein [Marinitoga sp. 1135]NUU94792.1 hypothetical protein [Marinitoga sp. 1135]
MKKVGLFFIGILLLFSLSSCISDLFSKVEYPEISGYWKIDTTLSGLKNTDYMFIEPNADTDKITGYFQKHDIFGEPTDKYNINGNFEDMTNLNFSYEYSFNNSKVKIEYSGILKDNSISGKVNQFVNGMLYASGTFDSTYLGKELNLESKLRIKLNYPEVPEFLSQNKEDAAVYIRKKEDTNNATYTFDSNFEVSIPISETGIYRIYINTGKDFENISGDYEIKSLLQDSSLSFNVDYSWGILHVVINDFNNVSSAKVTYIYHGTNYSSSQEVEITSADQYVYIPANTYYEIILEKNYVNGAKSTKSTWHMFKPLEILNF